MGYASTDELHGEEGYTELGSDSDPFNVKTRSARFFSKRPFSVPSFFLVVPVLTKGHPIGFRVASVRVFKISVTIHHVRSPRIAKCSRTTDQ